MSGLAGEKASVSFVSGVTSLQDFEQAVAENKQMSVACCRREKDRRFEARFLIKE